MIWYIYLETRSAIALGAMAIIETLPALLFTLKSGSFTEKHKEQNLYLYGEICNVVVALLIFIVVLIGGKYLYFVIALLFIKNSIEVVCKPSKTLLTYSITEKEDISQAIAANSLIGNLSKIFGPPLAGILFSLVNPAFCFLINAMSYLPFIFLQRYFKIINPPKNVGSNEGRKVDIKSTYNYILKRKELAQVLLFLLIVCMFMFNYSIIIPVIANDILKLGALDFGLIYTMNGIGNVVGNTITMHKNKKRKINTYNRNILFILATTIAIIYIGISQSKIYGLTLLLFFITGAVNSSFQITASATIQNIVHDDYRARVTAAYSFVCSGIGPFARLHVSLLIYIFNPSLALFIQGSIAIVCLIFAFIFGKNIKKIKDTKMI